MVRKKYVFNYYWYFYVPSFPLKLVKSFYNAQRLEIRLLIKMFFTLAKDNQIKIIFLQELYISIKHIISLFIIGQ